MERPYDRPLLINSSAAAYDLLFPVDDCNTTSRAHVIIWSTCGNYYVHLYIPAENWWYNVLTSHHLVVCIWCGPRQLLSTFIYQLPVSYVYIHNIVGLGSS